MFASFIVSKYELHKEYHITIRWQETAFVRKKPHAKAAPKLLFTQLHISRDLVHISHDLVHISHDLVHISHDLVGDCIMHLVFSPSIFTLCIHLAYILDLL